MAMKIVTGYTGKAHITSSDDAALYRAIIGTDYVLPNGNKFSFEIISNNSIRIKDGDILIQGHLGRIVPGDFQDLIINNGTQGMKRYDLIVARYEKAAGTGIESITLKVIEGTPAINPINPTVTVQDLSNGGTVRDVVLYRVELDGLSIVRLTKFLRVSSSLDEWVKFKDAGGDITIEADLHGNGKQALTFKYNGKKIQLGESLNATADTSIGTQYLPFKDLFLKGVLWNKNGYTKITNEYILQFGNGDIAPNVGSSKITFPVAFPTKCLVIIPVNVFANSKNVSLSVGGSDLTASYFNCYASVASTGDTPTFQVNFNWIAIGY